MDLIDDVIQTIDNFASGVVDGITDYFNPVIERVVDVWDDVSGSVVDTFNGVIDKADSIISPIWDNITGFIDNAVSKAGSVYSRVEDYVLDGYASIVGRADDVVDDVTATVRAVVERVIDDGVKVSDELITDFTAPIIRQSVDAANEGGEVIDDVTEGVNKSIAVQNIRYAGIMPDFKLPGLPGMDDIINGILALVSPLIDGVKSIGTSIETIASASMTAAERSFLVEFIDVMGKGMGLTDDLINLDREDLHDIARDAVLTHAARTGAVVGAPLGLLPVVMDAYQAGLGADVQNKSRGVYLPTRLGVNELAAAIWRGYIDSDNARGQAKDQGYSAENFGVIQDLARQLLGANEVITLLLRDEISQGEATSRLGQLGYTIEDVRHIKSLSNVIPGVQDLILMAVREAFTPEIAEKFGQYDDYPQDLTKYAAMNGLSEDWAKRYWASHWQLPSVQMGFEMLHRGVIDQAELNLLLRASDIMPFWRDKLTRISYTPFTRVDIRRMHRLNIIDDSQTLIAYKDIGYSDDNAASMLKFTKLLTDESKKVDDESNRELTLSMVKTAYNDGMIVDADMADMLSNMGYGDDEARLIITTENYKRDLKTKRKQIDIIKSRVMYNKIDLNTAIDEMNAIELPAHEIRYQLADLQLDLEVQDSKRETAASRKAVADAARLAAAQTRREEAERIRAVNEAEKEAAKAEKDAIDELLKDISMVVKKRLAIAKQRVVLQGISRADGLALFAGEELRPEQLEYYILDLDLALEKLELKRRLQDAA